MEPERIFPDISARSWEHPLDTAALEAFRSLPGVEPVMKLFFSVTTEKSIRLLSLASSARVSERQFPDVYRQLAKACEILDIRELPEVYVSQNPFFNAGIVGVKRPVILLNSSLLDVLDDTELLAVLGHELGHLLSGHMMYKTLYWFLLNLSSVAIASIPLGAIALQAVLAALAEWDRKSELSADRAGLLVTQNINCSSSLLMKVSGGRNIQDMDREEFFRQAREYDQAGDMLDSVYKLLGTLNQSHPFPVVRLMELTKWEKSGEYQSIMGGNYARRGAQGTATDFLSDVSRAARSYSDEWNGSDDPLSRMASQLSHQADKAQARLGNLFDSIFKDRDGDQT